MQRRPTTQDITWLLDLHRNGQLNLDPPYQRRSVWTRKDKQFFLDTIFRNYPSPPIFLHKTVNDAGAAMYHVVDGKQRTQTILEFIDDEIRIASDFGDARLNSKMWSQLGGEPALKHDFWNYQITVEMIDVVEGGLINEVFDRLNRNARRLTRQELRHAKFDGWFISEVEAEADRDEWRMLRVVTAARARRMADTQFISELMLVLHENRIIGFDQDQLDSLYVKYDDLEFMPPEFDEDRARQRLTGVRDYVQAMAEHTDTVLQHAKGFVNFYTLRCLISLNEGLPAPAVLAERLDPFMQKVETLATQGDLGAFLEASDTDEYRLPLTYFNNVRGANTDLTQRDERHNTLRAAILEN